LGEKTQPFRINSSTTRLYGGTDGSLKEDDRTFNNRQENSGFHMRRFQRIVGSRQTSRQRERALARGRLRPNRTKGFLAAGIIILVAIAASIYFYELNNGLPTTPSPPMTYVSGVLTPQQDANNFTNIFFISTTTRITYSTTVNGGSYGIRLFSGDVYNVTIEILVSDGHHFCTTLPPSIVVGSTPMVESFRCFSYGGPGV
jgi:hypothetical protein